jgi:nucleoside-diphosphate-sugar epimerase
MERRNAVKTYITGGTGFIGTHLVRRLAQTEHELVCLVRDTSDVSMLMEVGRTLVWGDVTDKVSVLEGMVADLVKKPAIMEVAIDQCRAMKEGFRGDGSRAKRELGITYTPSALLWSKRLHFM